MINERKSYLLIVCAQRYTRLCLHCIIWARGNYSHFVFTHAHIRLMQKAAVLWMMLEHIAGTVPLPCRTRTQPSPRSPTDVFCAFPAAAFRHTHSREKKRQVCRKPSTDGSWEKRKSAEPFKTTVLLSGVTVKTENFPRAGDLAGQTHPVLQPEEGT